MTDCKCQRLAEVEKERDTLKAFVREVIGAAWNGEVDGSDIQTWAAEHGLIFETVATAEDVAGTEFEAGDSWFKYADWLAPQPDNKPDNPPQKTCGDCSLVKEDGYCGKRPNVFFYRGSAGQICLDFDEKEASNG